MAHLTMIEGDDTAGTETDLDARTPIQSTQKLDILVAEDNQIIREFLGTALHKMGYRPILMADGREAWDYYRQHGAKLVISDWLMPNMDGIELCKNIRSAPSENYTYIILLTSKNLQQDIVMGLGAGADDFVLKPCGTEELAARIKTGERIIRLEDKHNTLNHVVLESRNKIQSIFDSLQEEIIVVDTDLCIVSVNRAFQNSVNMPLKQIIGMPCTLVSFKARNCSCKAHVVEKIRSVISTGACHAFLDNFKDTVGNHLFKQGNIIPIKNDAGCVYQVIIVSRDVTEMHTNTEEIRKLNQRLQKSYIAINDKNKKLKEALNRLEKTQAHILQSEKMAAIGQLAAGVAHEINNPTSFISSNLKTLLEYHSDLDVIINDYRNLNNQLLESESVNGAAHSEIVELGLKIRDLEKKIDLDYICGDIRQLIEESSDGTERIKRIVSDLKDFAHPGEDKVMDIDINKGIDSTLNVVYNELKYKAKITKSYEKLPIIRGYPQQLNQVFMNILLNAAQAIEDQGEITIETSLRENWVHIKISDTGSGIPPGNISRIFDPFFTTKDVGKGTGLGMNIAYNIVKKHHGDIHIESTPGKGSAFTVQLPATHRWQETNAQLFSSGTEKKDIPDQLQLSPEPSNRHRS